MHTWNRACHIPMLPPPRILIRADGLRRCLCPRLNDSILARRLLGSSRNASSPAAAVPTTPIAGHSNAAPPRWPNPQQQQQQQQQTSPKAPPPLDQILSLASRRSPEVFAKASGFVSAGVLEPSLRLYEILIGACVVGGHGVSLQATAFSLLEDMKARGIAPNAQVYTALLRLLARSTDYVRRAQVLEEMESRWFEVGEQAWGWVVLGYLKDCQIEMALEMVVEREERGREVGRWVYKGLVKRLVALGEVQEALRVLRRIEGAVGGLVWEGVMKPEGRSRMWWELLVKAAKEMNARPPLPLPLFPLFPLSPSLFPPSPTKTDAEANRGQVEVTRYVWYKALVHEVPSRMFTPSLGECDLVLNCAARHADAALAADVLRVIGEEGFRCSEHHYASLLETTATTDTARCFSILAHMRALGVPPTAHTARPLVAHLSRSKEAVDEAAELLAALNGGADLAAVEAVIASYVALGELDAAFNTYSAIASLTADAPTTHTFNVLLAGCAVSGDKELALYTLSEMRGMQTAPDQESYDTMVRVCVAGCSAEDNPWDEDVWTWLEGMKLKRWRLSRRAYELLAVGCANKGDDRAWKVVDEMALVYPGGSLETARTRVRQGLAWRAGAGSR